MTLSAEAADPFRHAAGPTVLFRGSSDATDWTLYSG
jgi:hypothetical protein